MEFQLSLPFSGSVVEPTGSSTISVAPLPPFKTIIADPPWRYGNQAARGAVKNRYETLSVKEIMDMPVEALADPTGSHLYLWTTNYFLATGEAGAVVRAWGFDPKTVVTWEKPGQLGAGNYFRNTTEHFIFAVKKKLRTLPPYNERTCFKAKRDGHSRKPEYFYKMVERRSYGPFLEIFARYEPNGQTRLDEWTRWGNQVLGGKPVPLLDAYFASLKQPQISPPPEAVP